MSCGSSRVSCSRAKRPHVPGPFGIIHRMSLPVRFVLEEARDGAVCLHIETSEPLGDLVRRELLPGRRTYDSVRVSPAEYLKRLGARVWVSGAAEDSGRPSGWRYVEFAGAFPESFPEGSVIPVSHVADLSEGSAERRLVTRLAQTGELRTWWPRNALELEITLPRETRSAIGQVLERTDGVSAETWRDELDDFAWQRANRHFFLPLGPYRPREMKPPARPLAWFARRSGELPEDGTPTVAGVTLPPGARRGEVEPAYWSTDEPTPEAEALAARLAPAFAQTGLWPVLWCGDDDRPAWYLGGHGDLDPIEAVDPEQVLREEWQATPLDERESEPIGSAFPGLAEASAPARPHDPYELLAGRSRDDYPGRRLMLVPCNRPSDVVVRLGFSDTDLAPQNLGAVLRSWEERFAAVPIEIAAGYVTFSVAAPPTTSEQALALAAEHVAVLEAYVDEEVGLIRRRAGILLDGRGRALSDGYLTPGLWEVTFDEP